MTTASASLSAHPHDVFGIEEKALTNAVKAGFNKAANSSFFQSLKKGLSFKSVGQALKKPFTFMGDLLTGRKPLHSIFQGAAVGAGVTAAKMALNASGGIALSSAFGAAYAGGSEIWVQYKEMRDLALAEGHTPPNFREFVRQVKWASVAKRAAWGGLGGILGQELASSLSGVVEALPQSLTERVGEIAKSLNPIGSAQAADFVDVPETTVTPLELVSEDETEDPKSEPEPETVPGDEVPETVPENEVEEPKPEPRQGPVMLGQTAQDVPSVNHADALSAENGDDILMGHAGDDVVASEVAYADTSFEAPMLEENMNPAEERDALPPVENDIDENTAREVVSAPDAESMPETQEPEPAEAEAPAFESYKIASGDTLGEIALQHNTTPEAIQALNPDKITDIDKIYAEQTLKISGTADTIVTEAVQDAPPAEVATQSPVHYPVQAGDSLSKIGAKLGVDWEELAALNNITGPDYTIYPGQELALPSGAVTDTAIAGVEVPKDIANLSVDDLPDCRQALAAQDAVTHCVERVIDGDGNTHQLVVRDDKAITPEHLRQSVLDYAKVMDLEAASVNDPQIASLIEESPNTMVAEAPPRVIEAPDDWEPVTHGAPVDVIAELPEPVTPETVIADAGSATEAREAGNDNGGTASRRSIEEILDMADSPAIAI